MAIFNSYVSLPEGNYSANHLNRWRACGPRGDEDGLVRLEPAQFQGP
jgi:hypothetical protein